MRSGRAGGHQVALAAQRPHGADRRQDDQPQHHGESGIAAESGARVESGAASKTAPAPDPSEPWRKFLEELLLSECKQLKAAGLIRTAAPSPEGVPRDLVDALMGATGPPLLQDAARGRLSPGLAGHVAQKLSGVPRDAMQVRYFRFEETARSTAVASYFRRRLSGCKDRPCENGTWLDSLHTDASAGRIPLDRRSHCPVEGRGGASHGRRTRIDD